MFSKLKKRFPRLSIAIGLFIELFILSYCLFIFDLFGDVQMYVGLGIKKCMPEYLSGYGEEKIDEMRETARILTLVSILISLVVYLVSMWRVQPLWLPSVLDEKKGKYRHKIAMFHHFLKDPKFIKLEHSNKNFLYWWNKDNAGYEKDYEKSLSNDQRICHWWNDFKYLTFKKDVPVGVRIKRAAKSVMKLTWFAFICVGSKFFFPITIHMIQEFRRQTGESSTEYEDDTSKVGVSWKAVKVIESSTENGFQLLLQTWLIIPAYHCISNLSWGQLLDKSSKGFIDLINPFGENEDDFIEVNLGRMLMAITSMAISNSLRRADKPGMSLARKFGTVIILFINSILQIASRLYCIKSLFLMNVDGKYRVAIPFCAVQFFAVVLIQLATETRKRKDWTTNESKLKHYTKKIASLVLSAISSIFYKVEVSFDQKKNSPPKMRLMSEGLYQIFTLISNLILVLLPYTNPELLSTTDVNKPALYEAVCWVVVPWIISVSLEVSIILLIRDNLIYFEIATIIFL